MAWQARDALFEADASCVPLDYRHFASVSVDTSTERRIGTVLQGTGPFGSRSQATSTSRRTLGETGILEIMCSSYSHSIHSQCQPKLLLKIVPKFSSETEMNA